MFILIAYKPTSRDYCRGCLMATYNSDHEIKHMLDAEELTELWAEYLFKNEDLGCNEKGYDFWVFKDNKKVFSGGGANYYENDNLCAKLYGQDTDEYWEHYEESQKQEEADIDEICKIYNDAKILAAEKQKTALNAKQKREQAERLKREAEDKAEKQLQFERLKKELGHE